ncbi:hypothetical protein DIPPA_27021 [Diplonema papillatum]|nr:hypothetical protein DIPPA_27021 [Diplonema papillatum]
MQPARQPERRGGDRPCRAEGDGGAAGVLRSIRASFSSLEPAAAAAGGGGQPAPCLFPGCGKACRCAAGFYKHYQKAHMPAPPCGSGYRAKEVALHLWNAHRSHPAEPEELVETVPILPTGGVKEAEETPKAVAGCRCAAGFYKHYQKAHMPAPPCVSGYRAKEVALHLRHPAEPEEFVEKVPIIPTGGVKEAEETPKAVAGCRCAAGVLRSIRASFSSLEPAAAAAGGGGQPAPCLFPGCGKACLCAAGFYKHYQKAHMPAPPCGSGYRAKEVALHLWNAQRSHPAEPEEFVETVPIFPTGGVKDAGETPKAVTAAKEVECQCTAGVYKHYQKVHMAAPPCCSGYRAEEVAQHMWKAQRCNPATPVTSESTHQRPVGTPAPAAAAAATADSAVCTQPAAWSPTESTPNHGHACCSRGGSSNRRFR